MAIHEWPAAFDPTTAPVYTRNEITTARSADQLWPILIDASRWSQWYAHADDVRLEDAADGLRPGSVFRWTTLGVRVTTEVTGFEPQRFLAWEGSGPGSRGYHRWILEPLDDGGCRIVTEEVQVGLIPRLLRRRLRRDLLAFHQNWLEELVARRAQS